MTRHMYCSLCGTDMHHDEFVFDIRDTMDPFHKYHHHVWQVCRTCFEELDERRKGVIEEHQSMVVPGEGSTTVITRNNEIVEF